jgi:threonine synthase
MKFYSTNDHQVKASFKEALLSGLATDGGLYMPASIPHFSADKMKALTGRPLAEVAFEIAQHFVGEDIELPALKDICNDAYQFPTEIQSPTERDHFLELFHGPTAAFKDYAGRFMGGCTSYFLQQKSLQKNLLVATSGDTGGAIGEGFKGLPGIKVFILFPKGGVSSVQAQQLCTMGGNIKAIEVDGTFDDCQQLLKQAFATPDLNEKLNLMSANSINVGRVIPQSFYYAWASLQWAQRFPGKKMVITIPSGNLGNLTGGILAKLMGFPIDKFVVAHNQNDPFVKYLNTGTFTPVPSVHTLSNAMDIGHPNNYYRLKSLFKDDITTFGNFIEGFSFDDETTATHLKSFYDQTGYLMCPHTAVGHLASDASKAKYPPSTHQILTVATAHPGKFRDEVSPIINKAVDLPPSLKDIFDLKVEKINLKPNLKDLEQIILDHQ